MDRIPFGRWFGVPVYLEPFALFVLAWFALRDAGGGARALAEGALFGIGVFLSILVHELGHALSAKAFRLAPLEIVLHGFGGLTRYAYAPRPWPGIFTTFAGPAAGFALGLILLFAPDSLPAVRELASFNLFWSVVNLLPIYPLDGGHILAHVFGLFVDQSRAYTWAARVAVPGWVAIGAWSVFAGQFFILVIALMSLQQILPLVMRSGPVRRR